MGGEFAISLRLGRKWSTGYQPVEESLIDAGDPVEPFLAETSVGSNKTFRHYDPA